MVRAENPGPFTLDGTRSYLVGRRVAAVVDPGPDDPAHLDQLAELLTDAEEVVILVTHHHADHAGGVDRLYRLLRDRAVLGGAGVVDTDAGPLVAVPTPGHTRDHLAFHWPDQGGVFVGDLLLGSGDTTWLGEYDGCVRDFLDSLDRVLALDAGRLYPAHGPPLDDPVEAIGRFRSHRVARVRQVEEARQALPEGDAAELARHIYGHLDERLERAAVSGVRVMLHHVRHQERGGVAG